MAPSPLEIEDAVVIGPQPGPQTAFAACPADIAILGGAAGGGKALALDTAIPTPSGWTTMGEINPGDDLFAEDGSICTVIAATEIMTDRPCYEVEFSDGSVIVADREHLWLTMTNADREAAHKRTDGFRAARRAVRPRRGTGASPYMVERNSRLAALAPKLAPPGGSIRTTADVAATLRIGIRANHAVAVAGALQADHATLPLSPYLLGVWLGDGTTISGSITSADREIPAAFEAEGFVVSKRADKYGYGILGLQTVLRTTGVLGNKHIPAAYLRASPGQRLALLQGLMDTDGHCTDRGHSEFTTTRKELLDGVLELVLSLGIKAVAREGIAMLNGRTIGPKWRIKFVTDLPTFRLPRKLDRQKRIGFRGPHARRYIVDCRPIESVPVRCISVSSPSRCYLAGRTMIPTHNSYSLLLEAARHIGVPGYTAVVFRRNMTNTLNPGSIWDETKKIYPLLEGTPRFSNPMSWNWRSGAQIQFSHLDNEATVYNWHSSQIAFIGYDELTEFTEDQFFYMLSRNRSTCGVRPYIRATCNPNADSWLAVFLAWWIDPVTGYPIPERAGKIRWMIRVGNSLVWADTAEELAHDYPGTAPMSVAFFPMTLDQNTIREKADPTYRAKLMMLATVERERLLGGNWKIRPASGLYFQRSWIGKLLDICPTRHITWVRYWDLAATAQSGSNDPDYTVGALIGRYTGPGMARYVIADRAKFRDGPFETEKKLRETSEADQKAFGNVAVGFSQDPGQAGKFQAAYLVGQLSGYNATSARESGEKHVRFGPFSSQVRAGNVDVVRGDWNDDFFTALEAFPQAKHDDEADACSGAFKMLTQGTAGLDMSGLVIDTTTFHRANPAQHGGHIGGGTNGRG